MNSERNRPVELQNEPVELPPEAQAFLAFMKTAVEAGTSPLQAADQVFEAIKEERFYILTHPEWIPVVHLRVDNPLRAENPMNPIGTVMKILNPTG